MKQMLKGVFALLMLSGVAFAGNPDDLLGTWLNEEGTSKIEIYKDNGQFFGKIIWLRDPVYTQKDVDDNEGNARVKLGATKVDFKNPDEARRDDKIIGMVILRGFTYDADDEEWSGGMIYDPKKGSDYKAYMQLLSKDRLKLRGYIGISLIGRTTYWTRS
ncbi:MAG: DUF2147 domain-containing protein [Bacteroidetes bacterium]|nr:DUF2147 domain-containing protein [Bacteroidota bacterium]